MGLTRHDSSIWHHVCVILSHFNIWFNFSTAMRFHNKFPTTMGATLFICLFRCFHHVSRFNRWICFPKFCKMSHPCAIFLSSWCRFFFLSKRLQLLFWDWFALIGFTTAALCCWFLGCCWFHSYRLGYFFINLQSRVLRGGCGRWWFFCFYCFGCSFCNLQSRRCRRRFRFGQCRRGWGWRILKRC